MYAQSPESMKGFLTGLFYFIMGFSGIAATVIYFKYVDDDKKNNDHHKHLLYYGAFGYALLCSLVFYVVVAVLHTNRQRPYNESSLQQRMIVEDLNSHHLYT